MVADRCQLINEYINEKKKKYIQKNTAKNKKDKTKTKTKK